MDTVKTIGMTLLKGLGETVKGGAILAIGMGGGIWVAEKLGVLTPRAQASDTPKRKKKD